MPSDRVSYTLDSTLETVNNAEETATRMAAEAGFDDEEGLVRAPVLAPLRGRDDFRELVDSLGKRNLPRDPLPAAPH